MKRQLVIQRSYRATLDEVWELWTTKDGIEAWWGPEGFRVEVLALKVETGGQMDWAMIAVAPEMVAFMKQQGMKTRTEHRHTFTEVVPKTRLALSSQADFIPGVKPYPIDARVELKARGDQVDVTLQVSRMHDEDWTSRSQAGWESQLSKLEKLLSQKRSTP